MQLETNLETFPPRFDAGPQRERAQQLANLIGLYITEYAQPLIDIARESARRGRNEHGV